jgi:predicted Rdx family selenoprotein
MNHKKQSIGIVMIAAMASLLLAGTILAPTQASATSQHNKSGPKFNNFNDNTNDNTNTAKSRSTSGGFTDTASLKNAIRDGVSVNLEHRDQHMDQENLCYRANTCRQSNVGQNTLGNDNSVTGFADQSDNIPQAASSTPVTPGNQTGNQTGGGGGGGGGGGTQACPNGLVRVTLNATGISACVTLAGSSPPNPQTGLCTLPLVAARVDGIILCVSLVGSV